MLTSIIADMLIESNTLLLSTGFLVSLLWRIHSSRSQSAEGQNRTRGELSSRAKLFFVGSFCTIILSPALACLPMLTIHWFPRRETFSPDTFGIPLILSWVAVNTMAAIPIPYLCQRRETHGQTNSFDGYGLLREGIKDLHTCETFDETDGPTFLPQQPTPAYYDPFEVHSNKETKTACIFTPNVSWENAVELPEALRELIRWVVSDPGEPLSPSAASELLAIAAISIGVCLDGIGNWNEG